MLLTSQGQVQQQHHIANLLERIQAQSQVVRPFAAYNTSGLLGFGVTLEIVHTPPTNPQVVDRVLKDEDGSYAEELTAMKGANAFGSFYNALKESKVKTRTP